MKVVTGFLLCAAALLAAEAKLKVQDLPPAVRSAVQSELKGAELVGLSREVEKGMTLFEVETRRNGKTRDLMLDSTGAVTEVEEEIEMSALPAAARDAITKKATGARITKVESLSKGGAVVAFEAALLKGTKRSEIAVTPAGGAFKD